MSRCATRAPGFLPSASRASSILSSPPRSEARGSASPSPRRSRRSIPANSPSPRCRARAPPSRSGFRALRPSASPRRNPGRRRSRAPDEGCRGGRRRATHCEMHLNDPVHKSVLPNGLRVVTVELGHLHAGMLAAYVRAGSRHEEPRQNGVSHFLEHLFFRGSVGYPDGRLLNSVVEDVGGNLNGVTTRDHGYYYTPIHPDRLEVPFAVLGDMLGRPLFKEVALEREVILEEILDEVDEDGRDIDVDNLSKRALFEGHPLGQKIAGTRESVSGLREDDLRDHHAPAYGRSHPVLCAAGPLQHAHVVRLAEKSFGRMPSGTPVVDTALPKGP